MYNAFNMTSECIENRGNPEIRMVNPATVVKEQWALVREGFTELVKATGSVEGAIDYLTHFGGVVSFSEYSREVQAELVAKPSRKAKAAAMIASNVVICDQVSRAVSAMRPTLNDSEYYESQFSLGLIESLVMIDNVVLSLEGKTGAKTPFSPIQVKRERGRQYPTISVRQPRKRN